MAHKLPKRNRSNKFHLDAAQRMLNSGVTVNWGSNCDDWVSIDCDGEDSIFMQGDEARTFIAGIDEMTKRFRSFDDYTAALVLAAPYAECIWN